MPPTASALCSQAAQLLGEFSSRPPPWTSPLLLRGGTEQEKALHGGRFQKSGHTPPCCYATPFVSCCLGNVSPSGAAGWTLAAPRKGHSEALGQAEGGQSENPEGLGLLGSEPSSNRAAPLVGRTYFCQPFSPDRMSLPPHWSRHYFFSIGASSVINPWIRAPFSSESLSKELLECRQGRDNQSHRVLGGCQWAPEGGRTAVPTCHIPGGRRVGIAVTEYILSQERKRKIVPGDLV